MTRALINVVHFVNNLEIGGTELNAVRVLEQLDRTRYNPFIASFGGGVLSSRLEKAGIPQLQFPTGGMTKPAMITQGRRLLEFLRNERIDIIHSHDRYANPFAVLWGRIAGVPGIIASKRWGQALQRNAVANRMAFRFAHRVLGNSTRVGESLTTEDGVARRRVVVVTNFVDDHAFTPLTDSERVALRNELGLADDALVVGMVARLSKVKDHASLLKAIDLLRGEFPSLVLVLVGDGPERAALESAVTAAHMEDVVRFAGMRLAPPNLHGLFDVSVLSSLSEGFPNTIVEAMAAGRPVVGTDVGGVPDALRHEENGLLVPAADPVAFAGALRRLLNDADLRRTMGARGQAIARAEFSAHSVLGRLDSLYAELLAPKS